MTEEKLEEIKDLVEDIKETTNALNDLYAWTKGIISSNKSNDGKKFNNGYYSLYMSSYSDGSGNKANMCRLEGNREIFEVVIKTLEKQLEEKKKKFESM